VNARMGDRFTRADIAETHVRCNDNDDDTGCCYEGLATVEWITPTLAEYDCPKCGFLQYHEVD
jgi:hypothetical protein